MKNSQMKILLVDDDDINNFLTKEILSLQETAPNITAHLFVTDALKFLDDARRNNQPFPEVILVDINMPIRNGWDFLDAFEKIDPEARKHTRLYLYTSSVYYKDIDKAKEYSSVRNVFSKPLTDEMLKEIMTDQ
ncbi:MAG: response regulator receiver protein [Ferruginibacter sp.]|nr:response regulator receiver protein [Ferruginibacter sp.]